MYVQETCCISSLFQKLQQWSPSRGSNLQYQIFLITWWIQVSVIIYLIFFWIYNIICFKEVHSFVYWHKNEFLMSSYELWNFTQPHSILLTLSTTGGFLCVNGWQLKSVFAQYVTETLGSVRRTRKVHVCVGCFSLYSQVCLFLCSAVSATLLYYVYRTSNL